MITCSACREYVAPSTYLARVEGSTVKGIVGLDSSNEGYGLTVSGGNIKIANSESVTFVVKTSGQDLTVDAENATVYHFGSAGSVNIMAVANHSYHGKSSIDNTLTVSKGNIELSVDVPKVKVEANGTVSIKSEKTINSLVASSTSTSSISISSIGTIKDVKADAPLSLEGTGKVENIAAMKPITIALPVDNVEIKAPNVDITFKEGATKVSITVDEESVGTSFELILKGNITEDMEVEVTGAASVSTPDTQNHVHVWKVIKKTKATCTKAGQISYSCTGCSETLQKELHAEGHSYNEDGYCSNCGAYITAGDGYPDPICFKALKENTTILFDKANNPPAISLVYSIDDCVSWKTLVKDGILAGKEGIVLSSIGDKVYFKSGTEEDPFVTNTALDNMK